MISKIIIGIVIVLAIGGLTYKALNPAPYKHPLHNTK